ncbi:MAG TPA: hypothetical protein VHE32_02070 [Rhodanobacteraceae bacterium]|nr:hypothetical protein [Rhodanobacteraceae bacterium]
MSTTRTIAVTGATEQDAARIAALLDRNRHKLSTPWERTDAAEADLLLVDIESMYGQMDWLRARSSGRLVIAYTSAAEPIEPEFSLRKPAISGELVAMLNRIAAGMGDGKAEAAPPMRPANASSYDASAVAASANIDADAASEAKEDAANETRTDPQSLTPETKRTPAATPRIGIIAIASRREARNDTPAAPQPAATPPQETCRIDELMSALDAAEGPVRLVHEGLPSIILDPEHQRWYAGVNGLKPLSGWAHQQLRRDQLIRLDATEFANATEILPAQPYSRLIWLAHLARSEGSLDAGLPAGGRYRLTRWPQVEREFPKHFRIATAMMRGTGTIEEIAAQSTAGLADVVDFLNAYHALGYIACEASLPVTSPNDRTGLLKRVRESLRS